MSKKTTMKAILLTAPNNLELVEKPIPIGLKKGKVLIKMSFSPINPSDLVFLTGNYGLQKELPIVPGFEGSGVVIDSGGGFYANYLNGKRVACVAPENGDGTWAEYMVTSALKCVALPKKIPLDQGAMSFVNPLTAVELSQKAVDGGYQAIVMSAASSALSKMVHYQAKKRGLGFGGVVRKQNHVDKLLAKGFDCVVNSTESAWQVALKKWALKYKKVLFLDAIGGGDLPRQILSTMPPKSKMIVYGVLNAETLPSFNPKDFVFNEYEVSGYWLSKSAANKSFLSILKDSRKAQSMMADDFKIEIQSKLQLSDFRKAINIYKSNMSKGKVLFEM